MVRVCEEFDVPRSTLYRAKAQLELPLRAGKKRGPKTQFTDEQLTEEIRTVLNDSPFTGEGHRKVHARLRAKGIRTSKPRVLRLMGEANLLAPSRPRRELGPRNHDGTITTDRPDEMWGIDATSTVTVEEGKATIFIAVDHCTAECVGIHAAKEGTRFHALEPLRQGVREHFGAFGEGVAAGLKLRHDHGSQFISDVFQDEVRFLGIESSPSYVRSPEGNGCIERLIRTLKEQLLWVRSFRTVEELRVALVEWRALYNERWILEKHGYLTPSQARRELVATQRAA